MHFVFGRALWLSGNHPGCGNTLEFWIRTPAEKSLRKAGKLLGEHERVKLKHEGYLRRGYEQ